MDDEELALVYVAGRIREAKRVERALAEHGVAYRLEETAFARGFVFSTNRLLPGVGFYVAASQAAASRHLLGSKGFTEGLVREEDL